MTSLRVFFRAKRLHALALTGLCCLAGLIPAIARAQDTFEIRVEQYEQPSLGQFTLEEHLNDVGIGTPIFDGAVAPTNHQFHMSSEFTAGFTRFLSFGGMLMIADIPAHGGLDYAGWRVLPHVYLPESLQLPVKLGLSMEFSFQRVLFDQSAKTLEFRPIIERQVGPIRIDLNPSIERALSGPYLHDGWNFEPSLRIAYGNRSAITPALEYFGGTGPIRNSLPLHSQVHQIYPGMDWRVSQNLQWNFGIGVGLTPAGSRLVYKTILQFSFPRGGPNP